MPNAALSIAAHPDWRPIRQIHRADDSWISFCSKAPAIADGRRQWMELGGVRASELETMFPAFVKQLLTDSFFSLNGHYQGRRRYERMRDGKSVPFRSPFTDLQVVNRSQDNLRYLNAFYVDLDAHDGPYDLAGLFAEVIRLQDRKEIPPASILVRSGRGLWVLWLLCSSKDHTRPQEAFPERVRKYLQVQRAMVERLASIGADRSAKDAARCIRVPDSINSDAPVAMREVKYWPQLDSHGCMSLYTLDKLAQFFDIADSGIRSYSPSQGTGHRSGWVARWRGVLEELQTLREVRNGFQQGSRSQAIFVLTVAGSKILSRESLLNAAIELGTVGCNPPLSSAEVRSKVERVLKWLKRHHCHLIRDEACARMLRVTEDEQKYLRRWFKVQRERWSKRDARRAVIRRIIQDLGTTPSIRHMMELLKDRGIVASRGTVDADYSALSIPHSGELFPNTLCYSSPKLDTQLDSRAAQQQARVAQRISERRALIEEFVRQFALVPPVRKMAQLLAGRGCCAGRTTIDNDYHALGYVKSKSEQITMGFAPLAQKQRARFAAVGM